MPILSLVLQNPQGHRCGNEILSTQWELTFPWLPCGTARRGRPSWAGLAGRFALLECPPYSYSCWSVPGIPTLGVGEGADRWENDPQVSGQGIERPFNCPWVIVCSLIQHLWSPCYVPGTWDATEILRDKEPPLVGLTSQCASPEERVFVSWGSNLGCGQVGAPDLEQEARVWAPAPSFHQLCTSCAPLSFHFLSLQPKPCLLNTFPLVPLGLGSPLLASLRLAFFPAIPDSAGS